MQEKSENRSSDTSKNSSKHPVNLAILSVLSSGPTAADILKKKVKETTRCSDAQYYLRLGLLRDDQKEIIFAPAGRKRHYSLSNDRDKLAKFTKGPTDLEQRVIRTAKYLAEYMMTEARYDSENPEFNTSLYFKFAMFEQMLAMLRKNQPNIPKERKVASKGRDEPGYDIVNMHQYILDVLEYFKAL